MVFHINEIVCDGKPVVKNVTWNWIRQAKQLKCQLSIPANDADDVDLYFVIMNISTIRINNIIRLTPTATISFNLLLMQTQQVFRVSVTAGIDKKVVVDIYLNNRLSKFEFKSEAEAPSYSQWNKTVGLALLEYFTKQIVIKNQKQIKEETNND